MWELITDLPEGKYFQTAIVENGEVRNEALLRKQGRLWFLMDGTYVYYTPTHYKI